MPPQKSDLGISSWGFRFGDSQPTSLAFLTETRCFGAADIEERIAAWTMVPSFNGESIQVLHYEKGQKYDSHFDYFFHEGGDVNGGNRLLTILMYLSDVELGGETVRFRFAYSVLCVLIWNKVSVYHHTEYESCYSPQISRSQPQTLAPI